MQVHGQEFAKCFRLVSSKTGRNLQGDTQKLITITEFPTAILLSKSAVNEESKKCGDEVRNGKRTSTYVSPFKSTIQSSLGPLSEHWVSSLISNDHLRNTVTQTLLPIQHCYKLTVLGFNNT